MTQEEKQLLLTDLCARLPYGVKCAIFDNKLPFAASHGKYAFKMDAISIEENEIDVWLEKGNFNIETIKPYLRPMSSMTEEEKDTFQGFIYPACNDPVSMINWLNAHHFDYRSLIEKGLALEAKDGMYKTE